MNIWTFTNQNLKRIIKKTFMLDALSWDRPSVTTQNDEEQS